MQLTTKFKGRAKKNFSSDTPTTAGSHSFKVPVQKLHLTDTDGDNGNNNNNNNMTIPLLHSMAFYATSSLHGEGICHVTIIGLAFKDKWGELVDITRWTELSYISLKRNRIGVQHIAAGKKWSASSRLYRLIKLRYCNEKDHAMKTLEVRRCDLREFLNAIISYAPVDCEKTFNKRKYVFLPKSMHEAGLMMKMVRRHIGVQDGNNNNSISHNNNNTTAVEVEKEETTTPISDEISKLKASKFYFDRPRRTHSLDY